MGACQNILYNFFGQGNSIQYYSINFATIIIQQPFNLSSVNRLGGMMQCEGTETAGKGHQTQRPSLSVG